MSATNENWSSSGPVSRVLSPSQPKLARGTAIFLARRLPGASSSLPESDGGTDRSARRSDPRIQPTLLSVWPCSGWGLPSQRVTPLLVRSYRTVSPLPRDKPTGAQGVARRFPFCCTFPDLAVGRCYRSPSPMEPGLSSRHFRSRRPSGPLEDHVPRYPKESGKSHGVRGELMGNYGRCQVAQHFRIVNRMECS